jgi:hypothetical protein
MGGDTATIEQQQHRHHQIIIIIIVFCSSQFSLRNQQVRHVLGEPF